MWDSTYQPVHVSLTHACHLCTLTAVASAKAFLVLSRSCGRQRIATCADFPLPRSVEYGMWIHRWQVHLYRYPQVCLAFFMALIFPPRASNSGTSTDYPYPGLRFLWTGNRTFTNGRAVVSDLKQILCWVGPNLLRYRHFSTSSNLIADVSPACWLGHLKHPFWVYIVNVHFVTWSTLSKSHFALKTLRKMHK